METGLTKEEHDLIEAIQIFGGTVTGLKQRRFRFTVKVSIAFGIVLALILGIVLYLVIAVVPHINHTANVAKKTAEQANSVEAKLALSELTRCHSGNDFRENDKARWQFIINLVGPPTTPEGADKINRLKTYINDADAPRNCDALQTPTTTSTTLATPAT